MTTVIFDIETAPIRRDDPAWLARAAAMRAEVDAQIAALTAEPVTASGSTKPWTEAHARSLAERTAKRAADVAALRDGCEAHIEAARLRTSLDPYAGGRVVCIAWCVVDGRGIGDVEHVTGDDEAAIIAQFSTESPPRFVAHYGETFDVPFLRARAAHHGLTTAAAMFGPWRRYVDSSRVTDTARCLPSMGGPVYLSLGALADFLRVERAPDTITGADVPRLWESGDPDARRQVVEHCIADVLTLARVWSVLSGVL